MMTTTNTCGAGPSRQTAPAPHAETAPSPMTGQASAPNPFITEPCNDGWLAAYRLLARIGARHAAEPPVAIEGTPWGALAAASAGGAR